jgi:hypothetical protein
MDCSGGTPHREQAIARHNPRYHSGYIAMTLSSDSRIWDSLRLLGAGIFVFASTIGVVFLLSKLFPNAPSWLVPPVVLLAFFGAILAGVVFFHGKLPAGRSEAEIQADRLQLEQSGMLISEHHRALRAFQVEESEDEGSHYFLELEDRSVLYLGGQFLYEYEPLNKTTRMFPCTQFTVRRHRANGFVVDILCSGQVLEPELIAPPFSLDDFEQLDSIAELQIIQDKSYDQVKAERLATTRNRR